MVFAMASVVKAAPAITESESPINAVPERIP
jgi:hypothetical protein